MKVLLILDRENWGMGGLIERWVHEAFKYDQGLGITTIQPETVDEFKERHTRGPFDIVIVDDRWFTASADVMSGEELAREAQIAFPAADVVFLTASSATNTTWKHTLSKPFAGVDFVELLRNIARMRA